MVLLKNRATSFFYAGVKVSSNSFIDREIAYSQFINNLFATFFEIFMKKLNFFRKMRVFR